MNLVEVLRNASHDNGCLCLDIEEKLDIKFDGCGCDICENTFNVIADLIEKYYIPNPLFEDGEPVNLIDEFVDGQGNIDTVWSISFDDMYFSIGGNYGTTTYQYDEYVKRPTNQDIWSEVDEYLNQYAENYMKPSGDGVYENVKMVPLDTVDNAMHMLRGFYEEH